MMKKILYIFLLMTFPVWAKSDFNLDRTKPIDILADNLVVDDIAMKGVFSGKVQVIQDKFRLTCTDLIVFYDRNAAGNSDAMNSKIRKLVATGGVILSSDTDTAKGRTAEYDLVRKNIILSGNVLVSRKEGIISGEKVEIFPETRQIRVLSSAQRRIHSLIRLDKVKD